VRSAVAVLVGASLAFGLGTSDAAPTRSAARTIALDVLPPGESGAFTLGRHSTDQLRLYDRLTPMFGNVGASDLARTFKPERFGLGGQKPSRVERIPRRGLRIFRDAWDVPHVYGRTRADVEFGAGWVTAEDRGFLIDLLRGPGRISALDVPGIDAFSLVGTGREVVSSPQTEAFLARQVALLRAAGPEGRQLLRDLDGYLAGINAYNRAHGVGGAPWTRNDVAAVASLIGAIFGKGGGDELRRSQFLSALEQRLGTERALQVWSDLREQQDPAAPVTIKKEFAYDGAPAQPLPGTVLDDGSFVPAGPGGQTVTKRLHMSNAILVAKNRSATGHPIMVAGPQVGYSYPEILMELDLHGAGIDARGAAFPGLSFYVLLGRGKDFAWSATSSNSDNVDQFVETLCGGDDTHYLFRGECREMGTFDAGTLRGTVGEADRRLVFRTTVHGPVLGYATVGGRRVAISQQRSTRGREILSGIGFQELNTNRVHSAQTFLRALGKVEFGFNWFYADDRDIALFSSGRLPIRAPGTATGLPIPGTGDDEWRGFLPAAGHVQAIDPPGGLIVNWNNKPGSGFAAADDNWAYGSVQRVDLLSAAIAARRMHTVTSVVSAMNRAATQDLRAVDVLPAIAAVLGTGTAPNPHDQQLLDLLLAWREAGASRLDRNLDGTIDDPGAAIMDAAWPKLADAVMSPVLGPLDDRLAKLMTRDDAANSSGSSYFSGWYGYVNTDLRDLVGAGPLGGFSTRFCGDGSLAACRASLWAALDAAGNQLATAQGPDPTAWRSDATGERIRFSGFLSATMRWANRPTFQQVVSFANHRPR
jgi:acyl-homoserine lactone acylase PvdQ